MAERPHDHGPRELTDSLTQRWYGVFRSVGEAPITSEQLSLTRRRIRRQGMRLGLGVAALTVPGLLLFLMGPSLDDSGAAIGTLAVGAAGIFGVIAILDAANLLFRWGRIDADGSVETFLGEVQFHQMVDMLTARIMTKAGVRPGGSHYLRVLRCNGVLLSVNEHPVYAFIQGQVAVTATVRTSTAPLNSVERREVDVMGRRLLRHSLWRWPWSLGIGVGFGTLIGSPLTLLAEGVGIAARILATAGLAAGLATIAAVVSRLLARRQVALMTRDADTGPVAFGEITRLPLSAIVWTVNDYPGPARLASGGLADEQHANPTQSTRPVTF